MSFPYTFQSNFGAGDKGLWDTEVDTHTILDFPHYTELARYKLAPYRGAYCMRIKCEAGTTDAYLKEATSLDIAAAGVLYLRWYFCLGWDFSMVNADKLSMLELESVSDTTTVVAVGLQRTGTNIEVWWNLAQATAAPSTYVLGTLTSELGKWHCIEVRVDVDAGGGNDGTIDVWIDDGVAGTQIASLDQGAVVDGKLGLMGPDAGTKGTILFADFIADDAQIYADGNRFRALNQWVTNLNSHPLIGPGRFSLAFTDSSADGTATVYDQDGTATRLEPVVTLRNATAKDFVVGHDIFEVSHGAYIVMTGAAPQAYLSIEQGGMTSQDAYINRGLKNGRPMPYATG